MNNVLLKVKVEYLVASKNAVGRVLDLDIAPKTGGIKVGFRRGGMAKSREYGFGVFDALDKVFGMRDRCALEEVR